MNKLLVFFLAAAVLALAWVVGQSMGSAEAQNLPMHESTCDPANTNHCIVPGASGAMPTGGGSSRLNLTSATAVKATPGYLATITVLVAGSASGTANDVATTGAAAVANQVFTIPNTLGVYNVNFPMAVGIVVVPGTGMTVSVAYN